MKKFLALILALVMSMSLIACGGNDAAEEAPADDSAAEETVEPITLRVAVQQNEDHETCKAVRRIAEKVEAETNGGLILDIYSDSVLGDYTAVFDEVRMGTIDMAVQSFSGEYDPAFEIGYLPYLFTNYEESKNVLSEGSNTYKMISDKCNENGLTFLGYFAEGFVQVGMVVPVDNMGDPNAEKTALVRCPAIESGRLAMDCQGFPTVTIPYADLYTAMQTGVCDGWIGGTPQLNYSDFRDVIKYYVPYNVFAENIGFLMSQDVFNGMPEDLQTLITTTFTEESVNSFTTAKTGDEEAMQKMADYGITILELTDEEMQAYIDHVIATTWPKLTKNIGEDILNGLIEANAAGDAAETEEAAEA